MNLALAMWMPGGWEWIIILVIALLVFGRKLPDVARSVGKSIVEFKKGIKDIETDIENESRVSSPKPGRLDQKVEDDRKSSASSKKDESRSEESSRASG